MGNEPVKESSLVVGIENDDPEYITSKLTDTDDEVFNYLKYSIVCSSYCVSKLLLNEMIGRISKMTGYRQYGLMSNLMLFIFRYGSLEITILFKGTIEANNAQRLVNHVARETSMPSLLYCDVYADAFVSGDCTKVKVVCEILGTKFEED